MTTDPIDPTERKSDADALLAAIVASSDDAIISKSLEGTILTWNAGAERLFGYTAAEAIGQPITMLIPPDRVDEEEKLLSRLRGGKRIDHFETVRVTKDGRRRDISLSVSPVFDREGRIVAASKVARDITDAKRAAEELRSAQEQFRVVTDNMAIAVTRCSRDLKFRWASPGYLRWLDRAGENVVGKPILNIIGERALEGIKPYIERVLGGERVEFEKEIRFSSVGARWISAVYTPTRDATGDVDGWVAVITDTTAHRRLEAALRDADRRKDEFLAVLAHELRNPLAPIRNAMYILHHNTGSDPAMAEVAGMIERQVEHMVRLVDDLLEVSRITRGKIELREQLLDLSPVVQSALETSLPLIDAGRHRLTLDLPATPVRVQGDPIRLAQVFSNILNNAAKYTEPRGNIWVSVRREGQDAVISFRDSGMGIPADKLPEVFDLFAQVDNGADRTQGGLGIGLTLAKRLVDMHGGTITAHSEGPDMGSEFVVRLPVAVEVDKADEETEPAYSTPDAPKAVLVVDDNRDAARSLGMLVRMLGAHDVRVVNSGAEALDLLAVFKPEAILLDIGMPGMNGHEVARWIRERPELDDTTLIALTGWGNQEDRRLSREAGFDHHLIKPASIATLRALLVRNMRRTTPRESTGLVSAAAGTRRT